MSYLRLDDDDLRVISARTCIALRRSECDDGKGARK